MQLCFVSVHGPRETYFVDEPRIEIVLGNEIWVLRALISLHARFFVYFFLSAISSVFTRHAFLQVLHRHIATCRSRSNEFYTAPTEALEF
jgi:hypothetical protein